MLDSSWGNSEHQWPPSGLAVGSAVQSGGPSSHPALSHFHMLKLRPATPCTLLFSFPLDEACRWCCGWCPCLDSLLKYGARGMFAESLSQWTTLTGHASNQSGPFTRYPQNTFKEFGGHLALGFSLNLAELSCGGWSMYFHHILFVKVLTGPGQVQGGRKIDPTF